MLWNLSLSKWNRCNSIQVWTTIGTQRWIIQSHILTQWRKSIKTRNNRRFWDIISVLKCLWIPVPDFLQWFLFVNQTKTGFTRQPGIKRILNTTSNFKHSRLECYSSKKCSPQNFFLIFNINLEGYWNRPSKEFWWIWQELFRANQKEVKIQICGMKNLEYPLESPSLLKWG